MTSHNTETLWREFSGRLRAWLSSRVSNPQDVDDLLQEAFLRVHRFPPREDINIVGWLFTVVRNVLNDYYRSSRPETPLPEAEIQDWERFEVSESEIEAASWLRIMTLALPPKYGQPLIRSDFEGASMKEIAQEFELSVPGAKSRVQRGRKLLAESLHDCCAFHFDHQGRLESWNPKHCDC